MPTDEKPTKPKGILRKKSKSGNVIRVGPPAGYCDEMSYDEALTERRYFFSQMEQIEKTVAEFEKIDPRGAWGCELTEMYKEFRNMIKCCKRIAGLCEKHMVDLVKEGK